MTIALWIIAVVEVIRMLQNTLQLKALYSNKTNQDEAYKAFIKSLEKNEKETVQSWLDECLKSMEQEIK